MRLRGEVRGGTTLWNLEEGSMQLVILVRGVYERKKKHSVFVEFILAAATVRNDYWANY